MMRTFYCLLSLIILGTSSVLALNKPSKSVFDTRIRYTSYNAEDVVQLDTVIGIATHIVLEEGEQYLTHAFGDAQAYAFAVQKNHIFLKPKGENADTNLTVVTDRRSYHFRLSYQPSLQASSVYQLVFNYPDSLFKEQQKRLQKDFLESRFRNLKSPCNLDYSMSGDLDISPIHVWDNGNFTYFKFAQNVDLPVIYMVDEDEQESMVNRHSIGEGSNIIVVHKVHPRWILRLHERALAVYNESWKKNSPLPFSGTAVPGVKRVIKEGL